MYYAWSWWWMLAWLIPMGLMLWMIFGWTGGRYEYGRRSGAWDRDERMRRNAGRHRGRGPRGYRRADTRIYEEVCDRLMLDDDLDASDVEVRVNEGKVTLDGTVATRMERRIAEVLAETTPGVSDVDDRLRVGGTASSGRPQTAQPLPGAPT